MNEEKEVKVVTRKLDAGIATPIAVTSEDALNIARVQNENNHEADIPIEDNITIEEVGAKAQEMKQQQEQVVNVNNSNVYNQEVNIQKLNEVNDLVKIEKVKKENPKVVLVLIIILAIVILGFFIFELPWIINQLK